MGEGRETKEGKGKAACSLVVLSRALYHALARTRSHLTGLLLFVGSHAHPRADTHPLQGGIRTRSNAQHMMSRRGLRWSSSYLAKRTCTLGSGGQTDGCAARRFNSWPLGADERLNAPRSQSHVGPKGEKGKRVGKVEKALEHSKNRLSMGGPETPRPHG